MDFGLDEPNGDAHHRVNRSSTNTSSGYSYGKSKKPWNIAKYLFGFGNKSSSLRKKYDKDLSATRSAPAMYLSSHQTTLSDGQTTSRTSDSLGTTLNGRNGQSLDGDLSSEHLTRSTGINSLKKKMRELAARQYQVEAEMLLNSMSEKRSAVARFPSQASRFSTSLNMSRTDRLKSRRQKTSPPAVKQERKKVLRQILHNAEVYMDGVKRCDEILRSLPPLTTERQEYVEKWLTESSSTEFDGFGTPTMSPSGTSTAAEERSTQRSGPSRKQSTMPAKSSSTLTDRSRTGSATSKEPSPVFKSKDAGRSTDRISTISEEIQTAESRHSSTAVQVSVGNCPVHSCTCNAEGVRPQSRNLACPSHPAPEKPKRLHPCISLSNTTELTLDTIPPSETHEAQPDNLSMEPTPTNSKDSLENSDDLQVNQETQSDEQADPQQPEVCDEEPVEDEPDARITDGNLPVPLQSSEDTFDEKEDETDQKKDDDDENFDSDERRTEEVRKSSPAFDRTSKLGRRDRFSFRLPMKNRLHRKLASYISWQKPGQMESDLPHLPLNNSNGLPAGNAQPDTSLKEIVTQNKELVTSISNIFAALQTHVQRSDEDRRKLIDILNISESKNVPLPVSVPLRQEVVTDATQTTSLISLSSKDNTIQSAKSSAVQKIKSAESSQGRKKDPKHPSEVSPAAVTKVSSFRSSVPSSRGTPKRMAPAAPVVSTLDVGPKPEKKPTSQRIDTDNVESSDNSAVYGTPRHSLNDSVYSGSKAGSSNRLSKRSTSPQPAKEADSVKSAAIMDSSEEAALSYKSLGSGTNKHKISDRKHSDKASKSSKTKSRKAVSAESPAVEQDVVPETIEPSPMNSDHHLNGMVPTESARTFYISSSSSGRNTDKMPATERENTDEKFLANEPPQHFPVATASMEQACQTSDNEAPKSVDGTSAAPSTLTPSESGQASSSVPRRKLPPLGVASRDRFESNDKELTREQDTFRLNISDSTMVDSETGMTFHPMQSNQSGSEIENDHQQSEAPVGNLSSASSEEPSKLLVHCDAERMSENELQDKLHDLQLEDGTVAPVIELLEYAFYLLGLRGPEPEEDLFLPSCHIEDSAILWNAWKSRVFTLPGQVSSSQSLDSGKITDKYAFHTIDRLFHFLQTYCLVPAWSFTIVNRVAHEATGDLKALHELFHSGTVEIPADRPKFFSDDVVNNRRILRLFLMNSFRFDVDGKMEAIQKQKCLFFIHLFKNDAIVNPDKEQIAEYRELLTSFQLDEFSVFEKKDNILVEIIVYSWLASHDISHTDPSADPEFQLLREETKKWLYQTTLINFRRKFGPLGALRMMAAKYLKGVLGTLSHEYRTFVSSVLQIEQDPRTSEWYTSDDFLDKVEATSLEEAVRTSIVPYKFEGNFSLPNQKTPVSKKDAEKQETFDILEEVCVKESISNRLFEQQAPELPKPNLKSLSRTQLYKKQLQDPDIRKHVMGRRSHEDHASAATGSHGRTTHQRSMNQVDREDRHPTVQDRIHEYLQSTQSDYTVDEYARSEPHEQPADFNYREPRQTMNHQRHHEREDISVGSTEEGSISISLVVPRVSTRKRSSGRKITPSNREPSAFPSRSTEQHHSERAVGSARLRLLEEATRFRLPVVKTDFLPTPVPTSHHHHLEGLSYSNAIDRYMNGCDIVLSGSFVQVDSRISVTRTQFSPSVTKFVSGKLSEQLPLHEQAAVPLKPAQSNMSGRQVHMGPRFDFFHGLDRSGHASRETE